MYCRKWTRYTVYTDNVGVYVDTIGAEYIRTSASAVAYIPHMTNPEWRLRCVYIYLEVTASAKNKRKWILRLESLYV